jgi:hypothetical protein
MDTPQGKTSTYIDGMFEVISRARKSKRPSVMNISAALGPDLMVDVALLDVRAFSLLPSHCPWLRLLLPG